MGAAQGNNARPDLTARVRSITGPALVMMGEWDDFLPCALRDEKLIPNARVVGRERCGHGSKWRVETFLSEINAFLAAVEAGQPIAAEARV